MKQKFALLTIVGALFALAIPASSSASMYPAGAKFEFGGTSAGPRFTTSLGSCNVKVTGEVPKAPANEVSSLTIPVATPTVSGCTAGVSTTLSGEWKIAAGGLPENTMANFILFVYNSPPNSVVIRSTSLPGCKLGNTGAATFSNIFSNGLTTPKALQSNLHAHNNPTTASYTWANDGATCAIAGSKEVVSWESGFTAVPVKNLTTPTSPMLVAN
jgi:hypothetical protein